MVGERRVELLRLAALDPKSSVSAIPPLAPGWMLEVGTAFPLLTSNLQPLDLVGRTGLEPVAR